MASTNGRIQQLIGIRASLEQVREALCASNKIQLPASMGISIAIEHIDRAIAEIDESLAEYHK